MKTLKRIASQRKRKMKDPKMTHIITGLDALTSIFAALDIDASSHDCLIDGNLENVSSE